jgi:predicted RNA binding protein YcfA (HicA-like mRNA interferase family)
LTRLLPIDHKDLVRNLRKLGFDGPYSGGKHLFMVKEQLVLTVPNPHHGEIGPDLLGRILRQAGISVKEWEEAKQK